jgi:hypothetical protein
LRKELPELAGFYGPTLDETTASVAPPAAEPPSRDALQQLIAARSQDVDERIAEHENKRAKLAEVMKEFEKVMKEYENDIARLKAEKRALQDAPAVTAQLPQQKRARRQGQQ